MDQPIAQIDDLINFQPKQQEAHAAIFNHKYILYGGAAGGGKSYWLRWIAIELLLYYTQKYNLRGVRIGLFCEDYPTLKDRQLTKIQYEFPDWLGTLNKQDHEFRLHPQYGGGVIACRNLDDPSKYLSSEFAAILIDELSQNLRDRFDFLIMRMRWPGIPDTKFIGATNPGGIGHGWVKKLFVDKDFRDESFNPSDFVYINALYSDNRYIPPEYASQLNALPDDMRRAYMEGDWNVFKGQFFTEFRRDDHVVDPYTDKTTLDWFYALPTYCGLDYGYNAASCVLWAKYHDSTWYVYRELYETGLTYQQLKEKIIEIEKPRVIYADPSIWAKKDSPTSGADIMHPLPVTQAMNDRIIGWNVVRHTMKRKRIKIWSTCHHLIRTIPIQNYDSTKTEDLDTDGEDHAVDALRYLMATHIQYREQKNPLTYLHAQAQNKTTSDLEELFTPSAHTYARPY